MDRLPPLCTSRPNPGKGEGRGVSSAVPARPAGQASSSRKLAGLLLSPRSVHTGPFGGANLESYARFSFSLCLLLTLGSRGHLSGRWVGLPRRAIPKPPPMLSLLPSSCKQPPDPYADWAPPTRQWNFMFPKRELSP